MTASFAVGGRAAGAELIDLAAEVADGVYQIPLAVPPADLAVGRVTVQVRDPQGNETRVDRRFRLGSGNTEPTPTVAPSAPAATVVATAVGTRIPSRGRVYLPALRSD